MESNDVKTSDVNGRAAYRAEVARQYAELDRRLSDSGVARRVHFMNMGYRPVGDEASIAPGLGTMFPNRDSVELLLQLLSGLDLRSKVVADIGGGRGGNIDLLSRSFDISCGVTVDLTLASLKHGSKIQNEHRPFHVQGDAQRIPLRTASLDIVTSVETSCHYGDLEAFFVSVNRVLRPGGVFAYTDYFPESIAESLPSALAGAGFAIDSWRDISSNVIESRLARGAKAKSVIERDGTNRVASEWTAAPGSKLLTDLQSGECRYFMCQCTKVDQPSPVIFSEPERHRISEFATEVLTTLNFFGGSN